MADPAAEEEVKRLTSTLCNLSYVPDKGRVHRCSFPSDDVACKLVNFTQTASTFVAKVGMYHRKTNKCASKLANWQTKGQSHIILARSHVL